MQIQQIASPNYWSGRGGHVPRFVIGHGTAGFERAQDCAVYFASTSSGVSAHYIVGLQGEIIQCVQESDTAWANGVISGIPAALPFREFGDGVHCDAWWSPDVNPNYLTVSIEHLKPSTNNADSLTTAQQIASFELINAICERWNIPKRFADSQGGITGHFSMDPVNRSRCPGPYPWSALWDYFANNGENTVTTPNKWQIADAAAEWQSTASNFGGKAPGYTTGIAQAWQSRVYQGRRMGPPMTLEEDSTDWSGNAIKVQQFLHARCEWRIDGSSCRWFDGRGEVL